MRSDLLLMSRASRFSQWWVDSVYSVASVQPLNAKLWPGKSYLQQISVRRETSFRLDTEIAAALVSNYQQTIRAMKQRSLTHQRRHGGAIFNGPARPPMRLMSRLTASGVNGPPRSVAKANAESGHCRRSPRSARTSSPRSGCEPGCRDVDLVARLAGYAELPAEIGH
jgi:hypothetical protein